MLDGDLTKTLISRLIFAMLYRL